MSLFGRIYRTMTFGQSHSSHVGCVIEGFPSNFKVNIELIQKQLNRRRPGQSLLTTPRDQKDKVQCLSGLQNNNTLGSPLCFVVKNQNIKKKDYYSFSNIPRPGHADFTYIKKYGVKAESGGGRSSARQTIGRVIAGALAKQYLQKQNIFLASWVKQINTVSIPQQINKKLIKEQIKNQQIQYLGEVHELKNGQLWIPHQQTQKNGKNKFGKFLFQNNETSIKYYQKFLTKYEQKQELNVSNIRCPHQQTAAIMYQRIKKAQKEQNSLGGIVQGCVYGLPVGLGQPIFDKFPAVMAHAMMSLPATKGFSYGSGFNCVQMQGSQHNDLFNEKMKLKTNNSGGTLGGLTSGETFEYSVAFKPVSSIAQPQQTHNFDGQPVVLQTKGRHDPCVLPRSPPVVDNMAAIVVMDMLMSHKMQSSMKSINKYQDLY